MTADTKKWFIALSDHYEGPFTGAEVQEKVAQKKVDANPFVWCEGMSEWVKLSESPIAARPSVAPPTLPPQSAPSPMYASEMTATATPVTVVTKETVNPVSSPARSSKTNSKIMAPPPSGGNTPALGTARPKRDINDLSGFIEVSPKNADDRTEFIDKDVLRSAKKEAAYIIRENKISSQPEGRRPWRMIFMSLILFILLGLALIYGNILS
jgi:hypothetical protein